MSSLIALADARLYTVKSTRMRNELGPNNTRDEVEANVPSFIVLEEMVNSVDRKDNYTKRHSHLLTEAAMLMARQLRFSEETMKIIRTTGLLHDVGMICVPEHIIVKTSKLTPEEMELVRRHPILGAQIVGALPGMEKVAEAIRTHHERYDGGGYPDGLHGDQIPMLGRLIAVADAYSAMLNKRPHRQAKSKDEMINEMQRHKGTQFDPEMVDALLTALLKQEQNENAA